MNNVTSSTILDNEHAEHNALMYIIVMLSFYSFGVGMLIVGYLRREKRELEEDKMIEDFLLLKPMSCIETKQKLCGRLALSAFNVSNIIIQPPRDSGKIIFVWLGMQTYSCGLQILQCLALENKSWTYWAICWPTLPQAISLTSLFWCNCLTLCHLITLPFIQLTCNLYQYKWICLFLRNSFKFHSTIFNCPHVHV